MIDAINFMGEKFYYAFVLGYDLMHDEFNSSDEPECDLVFEKAVAVINEFMKSEEYSDMSLSGYDALKLFVERRKENERI